jgi:signal transduction histidine kinase
VLIVACKAIAIIGIDSEWRGIRPAQVLSILTLLTPMQSLVAALLGAQSALELGPYAQIVGMAVPTAVARIALSVGTLSARPNAGFMRLVTGTSYAAETTRSLLVPVIVIPALLGWVITRGHELRIYDPRFGAALLVMMSIALFIVLIMQNARRLYRDENDRALERQRNEAERAALLTSERAARRDAETASRLKDEFLANVSHELRTPLGAVLGWAATLRENPDPAHLERGLEAIARNAQMQARLVDDLLDTSRIVSGKLRLQATEVDAREVVREAIEVVRPAIVAKALTLSESLSDAGLLMADPARLQQIVWNLLVNAVKFTPKGGRIIVRLARQSEEVILEVQDTGAGIAPAFAPHVFEAFRQADQGPSKNHGGLGLGLAIARYLVEAHGGRIGVQSEGLGLGACFRVELPTRENAASPSLASTAPMLSAPAPRTGGTVTGLELLVVDDDADARDLLELVLSRNGAHVKLAASADEAMRLCTTQRFDVIVSDIGMPVTDGYTLMAELRRQKHAFKAIALTAFARDEDKHQAESAGFDLHLAKPIDPFLLIDAIASLATRSA